METNLNRNEKILVGMTLAAIVGFGVLFMQVNLKSNSSVSQIDTAMQIDYKMARPEEGYSEYSLNGREIDHTYEAIKKKEAAKAQQAKAAAVTAKPQTEAEKRAEIAKKKAEETQKKATETAKSQAQTRANQAAEARKKALEAQQAKSASSSESNKTDTEPVSDNPYYDNGATASKEQNRSEPNPEDPNAKKQKDKKTFAQWREQIFAQPTRETVNLFLDAHRKGEINATEVQAMAQDLLDQNNESLKGLGLYTLRAAPSMASLSQLVHTEAQVSATYKSYIEQAYLAYLQPKNVGYLNQALQTKDKVLIAKTLAILNTNLPNVAKGNVVLGGPRQGRDGAVSGATMSSFASLLPVLNTLAASQEFASMAQQVISYIQSSNNVAQS